MSEALSDYDKAIALDPQYADAYDNRGNVYAGQGDLAQAISDFSASAQIDPNSAQAHSNLAVAYYSEQEYGKAWQEIAKAEALGAAVNPDFLHALKSASTGL